MSAECEDPWLQGNQVGGRAPQPGGWNRFQLEVEDLDALVGTLRGARASFRGDRVEGQGGAQILVEDPSGNVVELFEPKARPQQA